MTLRKIRYIYSQLFEHVVVKILLQHQVSLIYTSNKFTVILEGFEPKSRGKCSVGMTFIIDWMVFETLFNKQSVRDL